MGAGKVHQGAAHHLADWLNHLAPCAFAPGFVKPAPDTGMSARLVWNVLEPGSAEQTSRLDSLADLAAGVGSFSGIVWPKVRTPEDLLGELAHLLRSPRWRVRRVPWNGLLARERDVLVALEWKTAHGSWSSVMGLAPHGSMPVTRRSPYAAVVWWPGGPENPHHPEVEGEVGFIDGRHDVEALEPYRGMLRDSAERTEKMLEHAPEDVVGFRKVAFCLPEQDVLRFLPVLVA